MGREEVKSWRIRIVLKNILCKNVTAFYVLNLCKAAHGPSAESRTGMSRVHPIPDAKGL